MGTAYFTGFLLGCLAITRILKSVGHVRSFSALAALASAGTLMLVLVIDPVITYNLSVGYRFGERGAGWLGDSRVRLAVTNLTDEPPPLAQQSSDMVHLLQELGVLNEPPEWSALIDTGPALRARAALAATARRRGSIRITRTDMEVAG